MPGLGTCAFCGKPLDAEKAILRGNVRSYCDEQCRTAYESDLEWRIDKEMPA